MEPFETPMNGQPISGHSYWKKFSLTQSAAQSKEELSAIDSMEASSVDPLFSDAAHYPMMYDVCLSAKPHTPVDFLEFVLEGFFHKSPEDARHMSEILSHGGEMPCTRCTRDIAETKIEQVMDFIEENPYTIECTIKES